MREKPNHFGQLDDGPYRSAWIIRYDIPSVVHDFFIPNELEPVFAEATSLTFAKNPIAASFVRVALIEEDLQGNNTSRFKKYQGTFSDQPSLGFFHRTYIELAFLYNSHIKRGDGPKAALESVRAKAETLIGN